jgi:hypothetical protein
MVTHSWLAQRQSGFAVSFGISIQELTNRISNLADFFISHLNPENRPAKPLGIQILKNEDRNHSTLFFAQ